MTLVTFDHCVIHVLDWERSNAFYREVIGADVIPNGAGFVYRIGAAQLNCHGPNLQPDPKARIPVPPGGSDLCFTWPEPIDGAIAHLGKAGVAIELGPVQRIGVGGKGTSVYFRDPDGSLMEFISYA